MPPFAVLGDAWHSHHHAASMAAMQYIRCLPAIQAGVADQVKRCAAERPFLSPLTGSSGTWAVPSAGSTSTHSPASHTGTPLQATSAFAQAALPGQPGSPPFNLPGAGLPSPLLTSAQVSPTLSQYCRSLSCCKYFTGSSTGSNNYIWGSSAAAPHISQDMPT